MKKALSLFLATLMLISVFSLSVSAASAPVITEAVATYDGVAIEWSAVAGASGYIVFREDGSGEEPVVLGKVSGTSYVDKTVAYNQTYTYAVAVDSAFPTVDFGNGAEITYNHIQIKSVKTDCEGVTLTWVPISGNVEYVIIRQDDPRNRPVCIATTSSATYTDTDVEYGAEYNYAVAVREADGGYDVLDLDNPIVVNYSVVDLKVPTCTHSVIVLEWSAVDGASEYLVYRRTGGVANGVLLTTTTDLFYVDTTVEDGKYYAYVIIAKDADYDSTKAVDYTSGRLLQFKKIAYGNAASTFSGVSFSWTAMPNASTYYVYRKTVATGSIAYLGTTSNTSYYDTSATDGVTYVYAVAIQYKNGKLVSADYDTGLVFKYSRPICSRVESGVHNFYTTDECVVEKYPSVYNTGLKYYICPVCGEHSASYVMPMVAPDTPVISTLTNTANGVYLKWNKVDGADLYVVYRRGVNESWQTYRILTTNSMYDTDVETGEYYRYTVRAIRRTDYVTATVSTSGSSKVISWSAIPASANGYYVYRKDTTTGKWSAIAYVSGGSSNKYTDRNPVAGATYRVRGVMLSAANSGKFLKAVETPTVLTTVNNTTGILFKWNKVAGATGYRVYRMAEGDSQWTYLTTTKNLYYPDYDVESGVTYTYTVRAVCSGWYSDYVRAGVSVVRLENPELLDAEATGDGITVTWASVEGAAGYRIYRKTSASSWKLIGTVSNTKSTSYLDTGVVSGVKYIYTVRATNGSAISSFDSAGIKCTME